jgi:hypothetical protein
MTVEAGATGHVGRALAHVGGALVHVGGAPPHRRSDP